MKQSIGIIGAGFVGTACETGFQCVKGLEIRIHDKYKPSESMCDVVENSNIVFVCVPTPTDFSTGKCDTSIVESVVEEINNIALGKSIVIKSTVPPGTTKKLADKYIDQNIVFNPEFLREKTFIQDFLEQDRIILGSTCSEVGYDNEVRYLCQAFIKTQKNPANVYVVDSSVAEMVKYMGNCMLASKVIFCNEMYEICKAAHIDYDMVSELVGYDKRIGFSHMNVPGSDGRHGFGGSCFSKDINGLICFAKSIGVDPLILETAWTKNLLVREEYEWEDLPQVNGKYGKNK